MSSRGRSLSLKVALVVLAAAAIPSAVAAWVAYSQGRALLEASLAENLSAHADRLADELDSFNTSFQTQAQLLSSFKVINDAIISGNDPVEVEQSRNMLEAIVAKDARLQSVSIIDRDGFVRLSSNRTVEGNSVKDRAWFADAMRSGQKMVAELAVPRGASNEAAVLQFSSPLQQGGFILLTVRAEALWSLARQLNDRVWRGSYVVLLDTRGIRLAHGSRPDLIFHPTGALDPNELKTLIDTNRFGPKTTELVQPIEEPWEHAWSTAATGGDRTLKWLDGNAVGQEGRLATSRRMSTVPWTVSSVVPQTAITQPLASLLGGLLWRSGLVVLAGFALAFFLAQRTLKPVQQLVTAADAMSAGTTPPPIPVTSNDELGQLVTQFNAMASALGQSRADLEARVRERTHALTKANEELTVQQEELKAQQEELERKNHDVERANQLKTTFLANMSHELRTPLNSVIGFSQLLADELGPRLDARHRRYLSDVSASGRHLLELINDILDLSKIEAGHLELDLEVLQARDLVGQARSLVAGAALTRQIRILDDRRSNRLIKGDAEKLRQVLVNLLSNAIKFSDANTEVTVGVEDLKDGVRFFVKDNGPGIEPSVLPRIFEPFVQGEKPLVKRHQGTGLGLAISRHVLERHGARLEVQSELGKGSTFSFTLLSAAGLETAPRRQRERPIVLLVETDRARAKTLREALHDAEFEVASAFEGESPLEAARRVRPSVFVVAPGEDAFGIDALNAIHTDDSMRRIPVVFTTTPQAAGVLPKPLNPQEVVEAVRRATGQGTGRVLVVDDDARARELIRATLAPRGYEVQTAENVDEALSLMKVRAPDVVLTDLLMPGKSGFDFIGTLAEDPVLRLVPVLVLTALDLDAGQREQLKKHAMATARKGDITAQDIVHAVARLANPKLPHEASERGATILVVDDHDLNRQLARALLEKRGYRVLEADGGAKAIAMTREVQPAVVLMDLAMPGMDGFEALDGIRNDSTTATTPVIAVTAMAMKSDEDSVRRAGFDGYVTKPIDPERLDRELERALLRRPVLASQLEGR